MKIMDLAKSHTIVIYDSGKGFFGSRAVFMMRAFGHPRVFLLDGGLHKWMKDGRATSQCDYADYDAEFNYDLNSEQLIDYQRMKEVSESGEVQIIENRPHPSVQATGTIPGAICIPAPAFINEDNTLMSREQLESLFREMGVDSDKPMAFSCGGGIMASYALNAAAKAGFGGTMYLYDGSWSEYSAR